jgi:hypothetical protein
MSAITEYRRRLSELAGECIKILGDISDAEGRLEKVKKETLEIYEEIDENLDK